jgi:hypothetical protein
MVRGKGAGKKDSLESELQRSPKAACPVHIFAKGGGGRDCQPRQPGVAVQKSTGKQSCDKDGRTVMNNKSDGSRRLFRAILQRVILPINHTHALMIYPGGRG